MPAFMWPKNPMAVVQALQQRRPGIRGSGQCLWAVWVVDSLHYLDDLDQVQSNYPNPVNGHNPDVVDIAHVRWASSSAITALDLCAAALGRMFCGWDDDHELDLRAFEQRRPKPNGIYRFLRRFVPAGYKGKFDRRFPGEEWRQLQARRAKLPQDALKWIDAVLSDRQYKELSGARNRFVHSWLSRHLQRGSPKGHAARTAYKLKAADPLASPTGSRDIVLISTQLSTRHVSRFFAVLDSL